MRHLLALAAGCGLLLALAGCGGSPTIDDGSGAGADDDRVTATLHGPDGQTQAFTVEVADDDASRRQGLMGREELPSGTGMLFVFPHDTTGAFWMKDTLVPLSIAFVDADGRVVTVRDMEPCPGDPCPRYRADAPYRFALEVPQGELDGVDERWRLDVAPEGGADAADG